MKSTLARLLFAVMLFGLIAQGTARTTDATTVADYCATSLDQEFLTLINKYRAANGAGPLAMSQTLGAAAEHHALDMANTGTLSHTMSDGTDWLQNIINHGYPYGYRSENIAWGYGSAQAVFDAWKASAGHNTTMLNSGFGAIGIHRVYNPNARYRYYWVTTFGSQLDTAAKSCSGGAEPTATATSVAPTATATATRVPPTATATRVPPTSTPVTTQPTATPTKVPVTATPTNVPPTATKTSVPPTATNTAVPPTLSVPDAPTRVRISAKPRFVQVSWRDNATNETGYRVYRSTDGGASWQMIADRLPANTSQFKDNSPTLQRGSAIAYAVVAYNASGESAFAQSDSATVQGSGSAKPGR